MVVGGQLSSWAGPARWRPGRAGPGRDRCCCLSTFKLWNILTLSLPPVLVVFCCDHWLLKSLFYSFSLLSLNARRDCTSEDHSRALNAYIHFVLGLKSSKMKKRNTINQYIQDF